MVFDFLRQFLPGNEWEYLGTEHTYKNVPNWVESAYWRLWKRRLMYTTKVVIKGKHYIYKIITTMPQIQGQTPRTYYRKERLWFAAQKEKKEDIKLKKRREAWLKKLKNIFKKITNHL